MVGESHFEFKANPMGRFKVSVFPERLVVRSLSAKADAPKPGRERSASFADIAEVNIKELQGNQMRSEGLHFRTSSGRKLAFHSVIGRLNGDDLQIIDYRRAAAAAMQALAEARPDAVVWYGQSKASKFEALLVSLFVSLLLGLAAMFLSGGPGMWGYIAFAAVFSFFMYQFYTRMGLARKPTQMTPHIAAAYLAGRVNEPV